MSKEPSFESVIEQAARQVSEKAEDAIDQAQDIFSEQLHQGKRFFKKHPIESMLIGFGVGCLVGICLTRKK